MYEVVEQENAEKFIDTYDKFFSADLCLPDIQGRQMMAIVI